MRLHLVVPVDVFLYRFELMFLLFVDAVEPFQLPVRLRVINAAEEMLDPILSQEGFELADALFASFAFVGVELASSVGQYFVWASVALDGFFQDL